VKKVCVIEAQFGSSSQIDEFFEATVLVDMETGEIEKEYRWLGRTVHWWKGEKAGPVMRLEWTEAAECIARRCLPIDKLHSKPWSSGSTMDFYLDAVRILNRYGATESELEKFANMTANLLVQHSRVQKTLQWYARENSRTRDQSWFLADVDCDFLLQAADHVDCGDQCQHRGYEPDTGGSWCNLEDQGGTCGGSLATELRDLYVRIQWAKEKSKWYLRLLGLPTSLKSGLAKIWTVGRKTS
jgi:hypothetical protein